KRRILIGDKPCQKLTPCRHIGIVGGINF
ncbi:hypothetical protein ECEC1870_4643, partial [Escherichia coli EC1870]